MPLPTKLAKAEFRKIQWRTQQDVKETGVKVPVQFNPETLKVSFSTQKSGGDQSGGSSVQFTGTGTTKLTFDLWFDVTVPPSHPDGQPPNDVRKLTKDIAQFITAEPARDGFVPPGVRFLWGTFKFDGVMESLNETLEFFSEDGRPLRASVSVNLSKQDIVFQFGNQRATGLGAVQTPGTVPLPQARAGESLQSLAARVGSPDDWPQMAIANDIENPLRLPPGTLIDPSRR